MEIYCHGVLALKTCQVETNSNGTFELGLLAGYYDILIDKPGYLDYIIKNVQIGLEDINLGTIKLVPGDINKDGLVDGLDILGIKQAAVLGFFHNPNMLLRKSSYDLNGDGMIDTSDISAVKQSAAEERIRTVINI